MEEHKETVGCPCCKEMIAKAQTCIREHPAEAALVSGGAGFLIAQLPLRRLAAVGIGLGCALVKPAAIFYGLYRLAEDCRAGRWCGSTPRDES
jgi:hypothetical protein